jgi:hypothetical protein
MENNTQSSLIIANTNIQLLEKAVRTIPYFGEKTPFEARIILSFDGLINPKYIKHEPIKTKKAEEYFRFCQSRGVVPSLRQNHNYDPKQGMFTESSTELAGKVWPYLKEAVERLGEQDRKPHQLGFTISTPAEFRAFLEEGKALDLALKRGYKVQEGHIWLDQSVFDGAGAGKTSGLIMHPSNGFRSTGKLELTLLTSIGPKERTLRNPYENKALADWFGNLKEYL